MTFRAYGSITSLPRTAVITGANQGLGLALVRGLAARWTHADRILLTGRDAGRVKSAAASFQDPREARVEARVLDVSVEAAITALADELGAVDVVFSNATARSTPQQAPADFIDETVAVSNLATTRILRSFGRILRPGGRMIVVASRLGTLDHLGGVLGPSVEAAAQTSTDAVDDLVEQWRRAVVEGRAGEEGWGDWPNIPSKVLQVAAVRAAANQRRDQDLADGTLVAAVCPGMIDTDTSRPWFEDMSQAQSPDHAAVALLDLVSAPLDPATYGELVRFGEVLDWRGDGAERGGAGTDIARG